MLKFINDYGVNLLTKLGEHIVISMTALLIGCLIAIPLGILTSRNERISKVLLTISSLLQTIPSLALLAMIVPFFGIGRSSAIAALVIYSLLPILRNTILGLNGVSANIIDAAKGMGMTPLQIIMKTQLPLAMPVLLAGVRLSTTYLIAWTTLASYIGGGGMGDLIFAGLNNFNIPLILVSTLLITLLTFVAGFFFDILEKWLLPKALQKEGGRA